MPKMWNKGPRSGPRSMRPPFRGGGGLRGGGPHGPYSMGHGPGGHYSSPMPHHHRLPPPNFEYGCGPPPPPPPPFFNPYGGSIYENGPPGRFGGPSGPSRCPLLPSPPFVPMDGQPMNFSKRGFKRKRGSGRGGGGGGFRGRNGPRNKMPKAEQENPELFCDTCDRGFDTESSLTEHRQLHKKCEVEGCSFEAHSKIVELHFKMQHETGFAERIMQLSSTEGIEKWKTERKKNFPSAENIAKRQQEQSEKLARGELLETKEFGKMNRRGRGRGRGGRGGFRGGRGIGRIPANSNNGVSNGHYLPPLLDPGYISFEDAPVLPPPLPHSDNPGSFRGKRMGRGRQFKGKGFGHSFRGRGRGYGNRKGGVREFGGTKALVDGQVEPMSEVAVEIKTEAFSDGLITDSEAEMAVGPSNGGADAAQNGVSLPGIVTNGADNAETDSDVPLELPSKVTIKMERKPEVQATPKLALPGALASLVAAYESEVEEIVKECKSKNTAAKTERKPITPAQVPHHLKQPQYGEHQPKLTLLEMLLAKEIRHERNVILQCVRYVAQNNFFDISKK